MSEKNNNNILPDNVLKFEKNIKNGTLHNIYLLQTTDIDGVITGEAYGKNLVTNLGIQRLMVDNSLYTRMYLGYSDQDPTYENHAIYEPLTPTNVIIDQETNKYTEYGPVIYDSNTRMYSERFRMTTSYINYNISGVTEPLEFKELGLGLGPNDLYVHSSIYDVDGNKSSIIKRPNEKLTIVAYLVGAISADLIEDAYNRGLYAFISPNVAWRYDYVYVQHRSMRNNKSYNARGSDSSDRDYTDNSFIGRSGVVSTSPNVVDIEINTGECLYEDKYDYISSTYFGEGISSYGNQHYHDAIYWSCLMKEKLSEPEELTTQWGYTNNATTDRLDMMFGLNSTCGKYNQTNRYDAYGTTTYGELPVTDFKITSMSMYNHQTKKWDISESFHNTDRDYDDFIWSIGNKLYVTLEGVNTNVYIYINPDTGHSIKSFNYKNYDNSTFRLFATDEYWDTSTYSEIINIKNIPENLQNKRYYIRKGGNQTVFIPIYDKEDYHYIIPKTEPKVLPNSPTLDLNHTLLSNSCVSDEYGYFVTQKHIVFPDLESGPKYFPIDFYNNDITFYESLNLLLRWTTTSGDRFIQGFQEPTYGGLNNRVYRIYDMTQSTGGDSLEYSTITMEHSFFHYDNYKNKGNNALISWSGNGFLCAQDNVSHVCEILDVYGEDNNTPNTYIIENTSLCIALNMTDNCVYMRSDIIDKKQFEIYDMKNKTVINAFIIPEDGITYEIHQIFGWREFVYILMKSSQNIWLIYFYDYNKNEPSIINSFPSIQIDNIATNYHSNYISNEEVFVYQQLGVNQYNSDKRYPSFYISSNDPTKLCYFSKNNNYYPQIRYGGCAGQLKYTPDGKQLIYVTTASSNYNYGPSYSSVYDMGFALDNGTPERYPNQRIQITPVADYNNAVNGWTCLYKNGVYTISYSGELKYYPIEYLIPHQITGTTKTITGYNNPFVVSNKKCRISFTNNMDKIMNDRS